MRNLVLSAIGAVALSAGPVAAQEMMADLDDFALENGQDLVELCAVKPGDEFQAEATLFCYGVMEGIIQYHDAIARGPDGDWIVCPEGEVSRSDVVDVYVAWSEANPGKAAEHWPAEAVVVAALDKWGPCEQ